MIKDTKMNPEEAAAYLDVTPSTMLKWRGTGKSPVFYKPHGKNIYYFQSDLDAWIKNV